MKDKRKGVTAFVAHGTKKIPCARGCRCDDRPVLFWRGHAHLANLAASVVIAKGGTYTVSREEFLSALEREM